MSLPMIQLKRLTPRALFGLALLACAVPAGLMGQTSAEDLKITVGKSIVIDYPTDVARISTSDPNIVDAVAVSTREILLHAKSHGIATVVVWAKTGQRAFYNISVEHNLEPIRRLLKDTFTAENIQIQSARDSVSLIGTVSSQAVADRAGALVGSLARTVVNNLQVAVGPVEKQVMLRVKFAEVNRSAAVALGANILSTGALNTPGSITTGQFSPGAISNVSGTIPGGLEGTSSRFSLTDALNVFAFRPDLNLAATIRALQSQSVLQILAEPNLVTTNGKEASFLVGGEFPVPVLQGGSNAGAVTIQFREFGIRLNFNPRLTPHNTLKMHVRPEVSTIDLANAVTFSGFTIPALATRRMETDIELGPGQSFVIGGLIDDRLTDSVSKIPGLSNIPLLGVLFKSREERKSKTELIVLVTPELVDPLNATDPKPQPVMPREFLPPAEKPSSSNKTGAVKGQVRSSAGKTGKQQNAANSAPAKPEDQPEPAKQTVSASSTADPGVSKESQPGETLATRLATQPPPEPLVAQISNEFDTEVALNAAAARKRMPEEELESTPEPVKAPETAVKPAGLETESAKTTTEKSAEPEKPAEQEEDAPASSPSEATASAPQAPVPQEAAPSREKEKTAPAAVPAADPKKDQI
ncbi:MAG: BON domain-containing protein [Acidimicrobiia bacterium]|nr:BON domain-containing protein [Acidimicrobiia bacterium]